MIAARLNGRLVAKFLSPNQYDDKYPNRYWYRIVFVPQRRQPWRLDFWDVYGKDPQPAFFTNRLSAAYSAARLGVTTRSAHV